MLKAGVYQKFVEKQNDCLTQNSDSKWDFQHDEEAQVLRFAESVLFDKDVPMPPACTLDVGRLECGNWAIVEANPCWDAGLYGCDPKKALFAIMESIIPRSSMNANMRKWVSKRKAVTSNE